MLDSIMIEKAYKVLGLDVRASRVDAMQAYRKLKQIYRLDKDKTPKTSENFLLILEAGECIERSTDVDIAVFQADVMKNPIRRQYPKEPCLKAQNLESAKVTRSCHQQPVHSTAPLNSPFLRGVERVLNEIAEKYDRFYGAEIVALDMTFLGKVGWDDENDSIFNVHSFYGSRWAANSIWNEYGPYGSDTSEYSPFNHRAFSPPFLVMDGEIIGFLSANGELIEAPRYILVTPCWLMSLYGKERR